ncbi:VOC family protein [Hansschlegelia sp.]|uniref:VOC family protein n=1 Tax=Hansschlegelia sp. TaxID=2041892 RepID=UPI002C5B43A0|nr:VOC family protein [Hansschlegelia sp.]HVI30278.1 VOC family protein [Hansschlegelia sp.]
MPGPLRLSLVTLGVEDLGRSTSFYEALGLQRSPASTDEVSFFEAGGAILSLYGRDALAADAGLDLAGRGPGAQTLAWNLGSSAEVDKAIVRMVAAGGGLVKPAEKTPWGGYVGYVADPDGHLWEIAHNPSFPLGADGRARLPR